MREILKIIKQHFILLLGTGLFTHSLFSFDSGYYSGISGRGASLKTIYEVHSYPIAIYYYYTDENLIWFSIGAIFIVIGLLKIRKKRGEN